MSSQHSNTHDVATGHFSSLLKHWRNVRRLTQIELAGDANVSARHLCFLETGRAQPSREMVQLLGSALDLPLEECNALHVAAGFVPPYGDRGLAAMGAGMSASATRLPDACSRLFTSHTKWKPTLPKTPCTSFSIQKACDNSS